MVGTDTIHIGIANYKGSGTLKSNSNPAQDSLSQINEVTIHDEESLKKITQEMYKQNLELAIRNKTLSVLRTLYAITMASLDLKDVAQRIVDTIIKELNFSAALISLVNFDKQILEPIAVTQTSEILYSLNLIGKTLADLTVSMNYPNNLLVSAIIDNERKITGNLLDILVPHVTQEISDEIEKKTKIKTIVIYPLLFAGKSFGSLTIGLAKRADDLSRAEKETLDELIYAVGISLDRAKLHEALKIANEKLQELDKLKDEFVSLASHELRTPMTAIKGSLSTILDGYAGDVSKDSREFLTAAYNENDRLIRLVNNLLNISRIEAGRFTFNVSNIDIGKLISEVLSSLQPAVKEKNIYLKYEPDGKIPPVTGDVDKVKEVLINLAGNAIKFTHKGGVTITVSVKDEKVITAVTDTGSGIAKEDQDLLFKKFSQVGKNYARPTGGTGLGLYISKKIVEGLQGSIWLDSTLNKGSTFYFSLPIAK